MREVWLLLQVFAARWKNRRTIGGVVVLIIVMISTFYYVRKQEPTEVESGKIVLGIAKEDTSEYADLLLKYFNENKEFLSYVELIEEREEELYAALKEGGLDAYLVIPERFAQSMIQMENLPIRARVSMANPTKALVLRHVMEAYENYIEAVEANCTALYRLMKEEGFSSKELNDANVELSLELIFTALGKDEFFRKRVVETAAEETLSLAEHYRFSIVYFILLFFFVPAGLQIIALQKKGLLGRMKTVNLPVGAMMTGIAVPYGLVSLASLAGVCGMENHLKVFPKAVFFVLPWLVAFLLLGLYCKDDKRYLFVCSILLVCLAVFGGSLIPEEYLPDAFQKLAKWMPNRNFTCVMGGVQP